MTAIERVAPIIEIECSTTKCPARHRPVRPGYARTAEGARRDAAAHGWQVRPMRGPGSRTGPDHCPRHRTDGNGIAYTFHAAPQTLAMFNQLHPIGTMVRAYPGTRDGRHVIGETTSAAWSLGSGTPVVMVKGLSGGIALTHVDLAFGPDEF